MVDAMAHLPKEKRPEMAILPLGAANDFATACGIPLGYLEALRLAVSGEAVAIDVAKANARHFVNMATAGFGAEVTANTPVELKNFLGGGAYTITGVLKAINFKPYKVKMTTPTYHKGEHNGVVAAVCNGRQAGGRTGVGAVCLHRRRVAGCGDRLGLYPGGYPPSPCRDQNAFGRGCVCEIF